MAVLMGLSSAIWAAKTSHGLAMHGEPKYPAGFPHFDYVNPAAPQGGELRLHQIGSFDSFNPFIPKGDAAAGLSSYLYDTLMVSSQDEPFTQYGLLAEEVEVADDRSWIVYHLRPEARFSDGKAVSADDVVATFNLLMAKGSPFYSFYYQDVAEVAALDKHRVKFTFKPGDNRELALIVGQLPVLPAHYWKERDFGRGTLEVPVGSGPYRVASFQAGKQIVYEKRDDYWGEDLPVNRGLYNFKRIVFDYYLDEVVALEAFKGGRYDYRMENSSKNWAIGYDGPALSRKEIVKEEIDHQLPAGMQGFVYNLRRPLFQDPVLRRALAYALDFEWSNKNLFHGQYTRTRSYFQNSEMAATGTPSPAELKLLEPFRKKLPEGVFTQAYQPPVSDGSGLPRKNLHFAQQLLSEAGYRVEKGQLYTPDGQAVRFEILLASPLFERIVLPFARNLKVLGVTAEVVKVDQPQYLERQRNFNYDMIVGVFPQSNSPGNEQRDFFGSTAAAQEGSRNLAGIQNPAVDALIDSIVRATTREQLITATRALDRVLQWHYYVIPHWYVDHFRVAYRHVLAHPDQMPPYGLPLDAWWYKGKP